jgi:protein-L-isoaspartate(D-aspartate) O-methyltransferase
MNGSHIKGSGMTSQRTRERMIERLGDKGIRDLRVLQAIRSVPRHCFLDEALSHRAYEDVSLPIAFNQTISQPYIVARMTELLCTALDGNAKILEIGTGCGYQTAVLAQLFRHIYSIERIGELLQRTQERLNTLKIMNVTTKCADGRYGWVQHGPFDGVIITAAAPIFPDWLLKQLAPEGVVILPEGEKTQNLCVYKRKGGELLRAELEPVNFVPLLEGVQR